MIGSLRGRLALLLLLANLPAAVLAVGATWKTQQATVSEREGAAVQKAELIATRAGLTLGIAEGVADTLAANPAVISGSAACPEMLQATLSSRADYVGILVSDRHGDIVCAAGEIPPAATRHSSLLRAISSPNDIGDTVFLPEEISPDEDVVLTSRPFNDASGARRAIGLLIRRPAFDAIFADMPGSGGQSNSALALIRNGGQIVSELGRNSLQGWRPLQPLPVGIPGDPASGMTFANASGENFYYAVAPVRGTMSNVVLATPTSFITAPDWSRLGAALLAPLLMLVLGIAAVFMGVDRLVLRWIAALRNVTGSYAQGDYSPRVQDLSRAPLEIADLGNSVNVMAGKIEERSHALQEALDGKNGLLRELHHRVKNNFQMIASLLALQRRELPVRLRTLLRVPEDRVLAMASAYKASYATGEIGRVSLLDLLRDIAAQLRQSFAVSSPVIKIRSEEAVWLDLDRAVPLGLLTSELMSAALDREDIASRPISLTILRASPHSVQIEIESERLVETVPTMGLAARLIAAYKAQLGADLQLIEDDMVRISMSIDGSAQEHPGRVELGA
ncbi:sensor histidine kinase [Terrihabitans sp. B22-R8]|uniref:sensor histidine kinase n=1 Tax=Terrihabitans sp. B22-R8 TaxID=3425128 RepID=UPI00403C0135